MSGKEIANVAGGAVVAGEVPEWLKQGPARGNEQVEATDVTLPRIGIIQAISPQLKKNEAKYIAGSEQGVLFNTLTNDLYPEGITFIPVLFRKEWVAFKDREKGGGFKGAWPFKEEVRARTEVEAMEDAADIELLESHSHIGYLVKSDGNLEQCVIACTKSALKFSRKINSLVTLAGVDRFAKAYLIKGIDATGPKGDYYTYDANTLGFVSQPVYKQAEAMYEFLKDKNIATNHEGSEEDLAAGGNKGKTYDAEQEKEF